MRDIIQFYAKHCLENCFVYQSYINKIAAQNRSRKSEQTARKCQQMLQPQLLGNVSFDNSKYFGFDSIQFATLGVCISIKLRLFSSEENIDLVEEKNLSTTLHDGNFPYRTFVLKISQLVLLYSIKFYFTFMSSQIFPHENSNDHNVLLAN